MGAVHGLRVRSPYKLLKIEDIKIENKPNEHGYLYLKCLIDDSIDFNSTIKACVDDEISVYEELEDEIQNTGNNKSDVNINEVNEKNCIRLFDGIVDDITTSNINGIYYLEIEALTSSSELDIKEKSRSFQNADMTYDELIQIILKDYTDHSYTQCIGQGQKIGKPLFQYTETDWNFLKRIASELSSDLYCDIINSYDLFYFGRPSNASYEIEDMKYYKAHKNIQRFRTAGGYNAGYHDTDYFYYEVEKREQYNVGDDIYFKNKQLYVNQYSTYALRDEVIHKYRLCRKNGVWQTKIHNALLSGASFEGKVIATDGEKVKLHLTIDENQSKDEASWFPFAPPTGNIMYCMPIVGTSARLYFPNASSEEPIVTGCLRKNGSTSQKTSDTTKRYLGTEHGSEIEMTPEAVNIKGGSKEPLIVKFEDNVGVTLTSHKKLNLNADDDIIIKTPKSVKINAQSQIVMVKTGTKSGFSIENEFHFFSENVMKNGTNSDAYALFSDEPKAGKKPDPPKQEKKGFNWGALVCVVAAVAVVAISVATFGAGAVASAALMGFAMGAVCGLARTAGSDIMNGKLSSPGTYLKNALHDGIIMAVTCATCPPLMGVALTGAFGEAVFIELSAEQVLGTFFAQGMLSSYLTQLWDNGKADFGEMLESGAASVLFAKAVSGAFKLGEVSSPFIKGAVSKIGSELEVNGKAVGMALKNMKVPKLPIMSFPGDGGEQIAKEFWEKFKLAKNEIKQIGNPEYTTKIKWGINDIEARPFGKGYWGKRIPQKNPRVDQFELKINPNNESFYLPHPEGGYVQFENLAGDIVQDGKLIIKQKSFYHVEDLPKFAQDKVIQEAMRQIKAAKLAGYQVEWLVSDEKAVEQLTRLFKKMDINISVKYYPE